MTLVLKEVVEGPIRVQLCLADTTYAVKLSNLIEGTQAVELFTNVYLAEFRYEELLNQEVY